MKKKVNKFRSLDFKNNKFTTILYFLLRLLVLIILIYSIVIGKYENAFTCLLVLILLVMPFILEEKLKIQFSGSLEVAMLLFVFVAEIIGEVNAGYQNIPNLDTVMHTLNGFIMGAVGFSLVNMANNNERIGVKLNPKFLLIASFCFSMTIGVLWEFFEFGVDRLFDADMQKDTVIYKINSVKFDPNKENKVYTIDIDSVVINGEEWNGYLDIGLIDTMKDLIVNAIGAIVFSIIGFITMKKNNDDYEKLIVIKKRGKEKVLS